METTAPPQPVYQSVRGRPITVQVFGTGTHTVLVMGGVHGDEPAGVVLVRALVRHLQTLPSTRFHQRVVVIPMVNPDGLAAHTRGNAHRIDLNRNFPTQDFAVDPHRGRYNGGNTAASEPETQAILQAVATYHPSLIISVHAPLGCINYDGPAAEIARRFANLDRFSVVAQLPRRTPGSLGMYFGKERAIPVITLEVIPGQRQWARHGAALLDAIGVEPDGIVQDPTGRQLMPVTSTHPAPHP